MSTDLFTRILVNKHSTLVLALPHLAMTGRVVSVMSSPCHLLFLLRIGTDQEGSLLLGEENRLIRDEVSFDTLQ